MELCQPKDISEPAAQADKTQHPMKADLQQGAEKPLMNSTHGTIPLLLQNHTHTCSENKKIMKDLQMGWVTTWVTSPTLIEASSATLQWIWLYTMASLAG